MVKRKITEVFGQVVFKETNEINKGRPSFGRELPAECHHLVTATDNTKGSDGLDFTSLAYEVT